MRFIFFMWTHKKPQPFNIFCCMFFSSIFKIHSFLIQQSRAVTSWGNKTVAKLWPRLSWADFPMKDIVEESQNSPCFIWCTSELWGKQSCTFPFKILKMLLSCFSLWTSCLGSRLDLILWVFPPSALHSSLPAPPCSHHFNFFCLSLEWMK